MLPRINHGMADAFGAYKNNLIKKIWIVVGCHNGKRCRLSGGSYAYTACNYIYNKIIEQLGIHIGGVGNIRFVRIAAAQQVNGVYGVFFGERFYNTLPFIRRTFRF